MITDLIFSSEIKRLEAAYNWRLPSPQIWWDELSAKNYTDSDFVLAATKIIYGGGFKFPTLGELDKKCNEASIERREREAVTQKLEEHQHKNWSQDGMLKKGISPAAGDFINNLRDYLNGIITRKDWAINQKQLSSKYFGRDIE